MSSPCELRRTASWGTRDAFSDGHIRRGQQQQDPSSLKGSSHTRTATTRGAALRRFHRSSMNATVMRGSLDGVPPEVQPAVLLRIGLAQQICSLSHFAMFDLRKSLIL